MVVLFVGVRSGRRHILVVAGKFWVFFGTIWVLPARLASLAIFRLFFDEENGRLVEGACCRVFRIRISQPQTGISLYEFWFPLV
jgi:hypothetical protein